MTVVRLDTPMHVKLVPQLERSPHTTNPKPMRSGACKPQTGKPAAAAMKTQHSQILKNKKIKKKEKRMYK